MRHLSVKQKKVLTQALKYYPECNNYDSLPGFIREQLESINNTEILWSECNRFIADYHCRVLSDTLAKFTKGK